MQATIFHYGSVSLITEPCRSAHLAAMSMAKVSGCILSYSPNLALPLWPSKEAARQGIMSIWNYADIIKVHLLFVFEFFQNVPSLSFRDISKRDHLMSKTDIEGTIFCP